MKVKLSGFLIFIIAVVIFSCEEKVEEEDYPIEPVISFEDIRFIDVPGIDYLTPDTLKLIFSFTDGDADLGRDSSNPKFLASPYHVRSYFLKSTGATVPSTTDDLKQDLTKINKTELIRYKDRLIAPFDTLPPFALPFTCLNWGVLYNTIEATDTLYFRYNPDYYNLRVSFWVDNGNGTFEEFDFTKAFCSTYNSVFPSVDLGNLNGTPFEIKLFSSKRGTITYKMRGNGFKLTFGGKKLKLRIMVKDNQLHASNEIETPEIIIPK
jgi:hypothetical protein